MPHHVIFGIIAIIAVLGAYLQYRETLTKVDH